MSSITLCVVVKNEAHTLKNCVGKTFALFDAVNVTDTGSDDGTVELLRSEYGIEPSFFRVVPKNYFSVLEARNFNLKLAMTDYVFVLDADETITEADARKLRLAIDSHPEADGFFLNWTTYKANRTPVLDYKLNLFKNGSSFRFMGERHPNITVSIRDKGGFARWVDAEIKHFPEGRKASQKLKNALAHLYALVKKEPGFIRYHWFLGMTLHSLGHKDKALPFLEEAVQSKSLRFPVECLNSYLVLADIYHERGSRERALGTVDNAQAFYQRVRDDFEVKVNYRLIPTLERMKEEIRRGESRLPVYRFGGV
jgi:glycosyltransferase involved in cell wall biosynthesis